MRKKIGLVGLDKNKILYFKRKYKRFDFLKIDDQNFFDPESLEISALMVLYEYPVRKLLPTFLKRNYKRFKNLEWLHLSRAGVDECIPQIKNYKFKFTSGKKIQGPNVSEHCLSLLLSLTRGLVKYQIKNTENKFRPTEIKNKKVLITGLGGIGFEIAKKINTFGGHVYSIDHNKQKSSLIKKNFKTKQLKKIVDKFDIIINCLPFTSFTKNLFNKNIFKKMKKGVFFINISRDQVVNMRDFYYYLNKGKFGGAGLDITSKKIMNKKIFIDPKKNFIITDHLAGLTTDNHRRIKFFNKNLHLYCKNKSLINRVSIKKQY